MTRGRLRFLGTFAGALLLFAVPAHPTPPIDSIRIRMEHPYVVNGPLTTEGDSPYSEVALTAGRVRAFMSWGETFYSDGSSPLHIGGPRTPVSGEEVTGNAGECGNWIQDTQMVGSLLVGLVHNEMGCDYPTQTHKSVSLATSADLGITWTNLGTVIAGPDSPTPGALTGEGDCTLVDRGDGFLHAYCLRQRDWQILVARAATTSSLGPGSWWKWTGTDWSSPGLGGASAAIQTTTLGFPGSAAGSWQGLTFLMTQDPGWGGGGIKLSAAPDFKDFVTLSAPLTPAEPGATHHYPSMLNRADGSDHLAAAFLLAYVYTPTGAWSDRYLIMQGVTISTAPEVAGDPVVLLPLTRWFSSVNHDLWTTTGPPVGPGAGDWSTYGRQTVLGYLLSKPSALATVRIDGCVSMWPGHPDHLITNELSCRNGANGFSRPRADGWAYPVQQPGTVPFYRCFSPLKNSHFASLNSGCEGLGNMEWRLGYLHPVDADAAGPWY